MANCLFTCPSTYLNVQHWRDEDDKAAPDNEYEAVLCKACTRLHLINRKTGKVLGQEDEPSTDDKQPNRIRPE
jgi:hypothetical protein